MKEDKLGKAWITHWKKVYKNLSRKTQSKETI
jgi:hypothetical protein